MSSTTSTAAMPTAQQPSHSLANIFAHPGSTWAGVGIVAATIATAIQANSLPTTAAGWISFAVSLGVALMAALGK